MTSAGSVTTWIRQLQSGDPAAIQKLWDRYFDRLVRLARRRLGAAARRVTDEEDLALSAFKSLWLGAQHGRFPLLRDRENLWGLLVFITRQKVADLLEYQRAKKRGGGKVRGESGFTGDEGLAGIGQVLGKDPGPESLAELAENLERLLARLDNDTLRSVALQIMAGHTREEIAQQLGCTRHTVTRKLKLIRKTWLAEAPR